jgi:manganese transport protein
MNSAAHLIASLWRRLPTTATAPFCPSQIRETVPIPLSAPLLKRFFRYAGIGFLVSVGYMDPGNWATDIEAGSRFAYGLLSAVLISSLVAMLLQTLCVRLGMASGRDIAQLCRQRFGWSTNLALWVLAQIAIVACDFAEVLGTALALKLLLGLPLSWGILLTALDTIVVLALQGAGELRLEAIVTALVVIIAAAFGIEIVFSNPDWHAVASGLVPSRTTMSQNGAWLVAIGILGATVMPHNLYLHSSAVNSRRVLGGREAKADAIRLLTWDAIATLTLAFLVNAAILIVAAGVLHAHGYREITGIEDAYKLMAPILGTAAAALVFALALLASGQSSTLTGTMAGQIVLEGFLDLRVPCWQQRLFTRLTSIAPAWIAVMLFGDDVITELLVWSQVVLSMQLPFAMVPLFIFCADKDLMGPWASPKLLTAICWLIGAGIAAANLYLVYDLWAA